MSKGALLVLLTALCAAQDQRDLRIEPLSRPGPQRASGARWAVIVGISSYQHLPPAAQLRFAHRDAAQFSTFLRSTAGGAIPGDHIQVPPGGVIATREGASGKDTAPFRVEPSGKSAENTCGPGCTEEVRARAARLRTPSRPAPTLGR